MSENDHITVRQISVIIGTLLLLIAVFVVNNLYQQRMPALQNTNEWAAAATALSVAASLETTDFDVLTISHSLLVKTKECASNCDQPLPGISGTSSVCGHWQRLESNVQDEHTQALYKGIPVLRCNQNDSLVSSPGSSYEGIMLICLVKNAILTACVTQSGKVSKWDTAHGMWIVDPDTHESFLLAKSIIAQVGKLTTAANEEK
jgi:hypothetical protein